MATTLSGRDSPRRRRSERIIVLCLCVAAAATYAVRAGQDRNWDQRNYHVYNVYAWLNGESFVELAPAQIQSWLNPLPHVPQYLLIRYAPPVVAGAAMGAIAGINGLLLWVLIRRLQGHDSGVIARSCAGLALLMGMSGSIYLSFLGTTFAEYLCSPFVLAGLVCVIADEEHEVNRRALFFAGLCLGLACGLKLTNLIYALGLAAALVMLGPWFRLRLAGLAAYALGGIVGFSLLGGYWATKLWLAFRNPMFPFFNGLFRSPWYEPVSFANAQFLPPSFLKALITYPFDWLLGIFPTNELPFREPRFAYVAVLLPLALVVALLRQPADSSDDCPAARSPQAWNFWLCSLFFVFAFAIWLKQFGVQRYALPLEFLTGAVVLLSLQMVLRTARERVVVLTLLTLFAVAWTRPPDWEHLPYGDDWFGMHLPQEPPGATLYVMVSWRPMSYVIPFLPRDDRFVRLGGNMPLEPGSRLGQRAVAIIRAHSGPIRTLALEPIPPDEQARLERFGLLLQGDPCRTFQSRQDIFLTCGVTKVQTRDPRP